MRIVFDTNTLIRAHAHAPTLARQLLSSALLKGHRLVTSNEILAEVTRVLRYPRFQQAYGLSDGDLLGYVQFLQTASHVVQLDPMYRAPLRDPSDLIVLQTAERGEADLLCSNDDDFFDRRIEAYCTARGIEVCDEIMLAQRLT